MNGLARDFRDFFVSLKLTIVLLAASLVLIFAATLDQVNLGVWAVQQKYFKSLFVMVHRGDIPLPVFPGGYLIGGLLLINLVCAHVYRFRLSWRKSGIFLTHAGLILLLVGEFFSGLWQQEYQMRIEEGQTKNYAESYRDIELAITDTTNPEYDDVVAIPQSLLAAGAPIQSARLPFRVIPRQYFENTELRLRRDVPNAPPAVANAGFGAAVIAEPVPVTYKEDERNLPSALVELAGPTGPVGIFQVWAQSPAVPQPFSYGGHTWKVALRYRRIYEPFAVTLKKFTHDIYAGTNIPKNFSSRVQLTSPEQHENREVLIYMNNPLRHGGLTFYQAGFDGEHTTVLQVVRNPSWLVPYISCALIALGLVVQFLLHLGRFIRRRADLPAAAAAAAP